MAAKLKLAENLDLPLDAVTQAIAVLAKRRAGKSFLARRFAEQLHHGGQQMVIVDPKGDWWGILSSRDGKGAGLSIVIIGGERAHVPLEAHGGEVVAKLVVEQRVSVLLDLSLLRKHEVATFMESFLESLYRLKAVERYRTPLMLIIDEADAIAPQKPQPNEARMLGAAEDIVRRGGQRGIGCMMITQRSAVLNKNVLTQLQILIALRTISPQDIQAINGWVDVHGTPEQRKTLIASLPSLPIGDSWVWSPGWPTDAGIFQRIHTLPIETFDSGATPKPGEKRVEPKRMADVDLDAVREQMAATIERAKADDPKALRKRIAELERQVAETPQERAGDDALIVENAQLRAANEDLNAMNRTLTLRASTVAEQLLGEADRFVARLHRMQGPLMGEGIVVPAAEPVLPVIPKAPRLPAEAKKTLAATPSNGLIRPGARRMLDVLAAFHPGKMTKHQVARAADMKVTGGTFRTYWGDLSKHGFLEDAGGEYFRASGDGLKHLGALRIEMPRTFAGRLEFWADRLRPGERKLLSTVVDNRAGISRLDLAKAVGMEIGGGTFRTYLGALRTNNLVDEQGGIVRPHAWLLTGDVHA